MSIRNSNIKIHFLVVVNVDGMRPCANYGHKYCSSPRCYMSVIPDGMVMTEENWRSRRQTYPSTTLSTTNPTRTTQEQTRLSAVRGRSLAAWAMVWTQYILLLFSTFITNNSDKYTFLYSRSCFLSPSSQLAWGGIVKLKHVFRITWHRSQKLIKFYFNFSSL
jgi:hypothetical protein